MKTIHRLTHKKGLRFIASMAVVCLGLSTLTASAELMRDKTLTIGSDLTYPPYAYMDNNKPAGFDVEFTKALAEKMQLTPEYVDTRFPSLITGIRSYKFDVIASAMFISDERSKVLDFIPYIKTGNSMMVLKGEAFQPVVKEELCGKTVGSIRGGAWIPALRILSKESCGATNKAAITVNEYDTDPQVTQALRAGAIDVQMSDASVIDSVVKRFPNQFVVTSKEPIFPVLIGLGVNKSNRELSRQLADAFAALRNDGSYQKLLDQYQFFAPNEADIDAAVNRLK